MQKKSIWILGWGILVLVSLVFAGFALWPKPATQAGETLVSVDGGTYTDLTPQRLAEMLKKKDFIFINTHVPYAGEIEQTDTFIPFEENGLQRVGDYPADKNAKIVLYCRSGRMSTIVAKELVRAGYTNVWNLAGGMNAWREVSFEVIEH